MATALATTAAALVAGVVPAFAHASFDVASVPASTDVDLVIFAPLERDDTNRRIEALFPPGFQVEACNGPAAWLCDVEEDGGGTVVTFETIAGRDSDIAFEVSVRTPATPGDRSIPVVQTYADGTEAAWIGPTGSDEPAPVLKVTGGDEAPQENTAPPASHDDRPNDAATSTPSPQPSPTSAEQPTEAPTVEPSPTPAPDTTASAPTDGDASPVAAAPVDTTSPAPLPSASPVPSDEGADSASGTGVAITSDGDDDDNGALELIAVGLILMAGGAAAWWWRTQQG